MSSGKGRKQRRGGRKGTGNQSAMGGGKYGNRTELFRTGDYLAGASAGLFAEREHNWETITDLGGEGRNPGDPDSTLARRLEEISPGLADRLGDGLTRDELNMLAPQIAQAMRDAGATDGTYSFTKGDPDSGSKIIISGSPPVVASAVPRPGLSRAEVDVPGAGIYSVRRGLRRLQDHVQQPAPDPEIPAAFRRPAASAIVGGSRTDGGEGLPHGLQPGDVISAGQPLGYEDTGLPVPDEFERPPGSKVWRPQPGVARRDDELAGFGDKIAAATARHEAARDESGVTGKVKAVIGGEGDPREVQPGDIIAVQQPLGYADTGITLPADAGYPEGSKVWRHQDGEPKQEALEVLSSRIRAALDEGYSSDEIADAVAAVTPLQGPVKLAEADLEVPAGSGDVNLPPSLRGLAMDTTVPVIISTHEDRPQDAGEFLGRLTRTMRTESGAVWPEGSAVWRNAAPPSPETFTDKMIFDEGAGPLVSAGTPVRTSWQAEDVLNRHARLAARYTSLDAHTLSYLAHLMNAAWNEDPEQALRMHWPVDRNGERGAAEARQLGRLVGRQLHDALTYQVTAPMVAKMRQSELLFPGVQRLSTGDLPAPAGFAWLDDPWLIPVSDGLLPVRAVSWEKVTVPAARFTLGRLGSADAIRLVFWVHLPDTVASGHFKADDERIVILGRELGDLIPHHVSMLPFNYRFVLKDTHEDESMAMIALIHSLWVFLGMELSASSRVRPGSQSHRKHILRSIRHDAVHVITLRRVSYISDGTGAHREVNRTCKWWVEDFYRHLGAYTDEDENGRPRRHEAVPAGHARTDPDGDEHDICAVCEARGQTVRITLVHGHRRGPANLPWKTPARGRTVHRLSR